MTNHLIAHTLEQVIKYMAAILFSSKMTKINVCAYSLYLGPCLFEC